MTPDDRTPPRPAPVRSTGPTDAPPPARRPWVPPAVRDLGSVRHLVRAASGPFGDPAAGGVGKRRTP